MYKKLLGISVSAILISSCSLQPKAKLTLTKIDAEGRLIAVIFDSDIDILSPHRTNKYQIPTSTGFDCVLGTGKLSDEIDPGLAYIGGLIEPVGMSVGGNGSKTYRFKSQLTFSKQAEDSPHSSKVMESDEITNLLSKHSRMRCRVRILAYFSNPYFSEPVDMPLGQLRSQVEALAREENRDKR